MSLENTKLLITPNGYKAGKLYSALPESGAGDSTFERATTATRINADGLIEQVGLNVPRVDYPLSGECPSLLLEPQRTNLLTYSEEFDNASWLKSAAATTITANSTAAPDGNTTADTWTINSGGARFVRQIITTTSSDLTVSFFVKANTVDWFFILLFDGVDFAGYTFNVANGLIGTNLLSTVPVTATIEDYGGGWFRCSVHSSLAIGSVESRGYIAASDTSVGTSIGDSVYVWGAQLEQGSTATSYIPTVASAVTRNTDVLSNNMIATVDSTYTALLDVSASDSRLKIEDGTTGFDLPLNGSGRIVMVVDSQITFYFPDNGQAQTFLIYEKPAELRNIDVLSKINETKINVISIENGVALQSRIDNWVTGNVNSYFLETDWSLNTSFVSEFLSQDWDYFPLIDTSSGTNFTSAFALNNFSSFPLINTSSGTIFTSAWAFNNLTSFPLIDTSSGTNFNSTWRDNNLTSFPLIDTSSGTIFTSTWRENNLTSFPLIDTSSGTNFTSAFALNNFSSFPLINTSSGTIFTSAWAFNNLTSFPLIDTSSGTNFNSTWRDNNLTSFPLIDTSSGASFFFSWFNNNLTSFPLIDTSSGVTFLGAWQNNNLTSWLPNYFDTCVGTNFDRAWENNAIDQTGVDNILVSINTARLAGVQTGTTKIIGLNGGTNATPSATGQAATDALRADGWTVNLNGY